MAASDSVRIGVCAAMESGQTQCIVLMARAVVRPHGMLGWSRFSVTVGMHQAVASVLLMEHLYDKVQGYSAQTWELFDVLAMWAAGSERGGECRCSGDRPSGSHPGTVEEHAVEIAAALRGTLSHWVIGLTDAPDHVTYMCSTYMCCPPYITGPDPGMSARLMHVACMTHMHVTTHLRDARDRPDQRWKQAVHRTACTATFAMQAVREVQVV